MIHMVLYAAGMMSWLGSFHLELAVGLHIKERQSQEFMEGLALWSIGLKEKLQLASSAGNLTEEQSLLHNRTVKNANVVKSHQENFLSLTLR